MIGKNLKIYINRRFKKFLNIKYILVKYENLKRYENTKKQFKLLFFSARTPMWESVFVCVCRSSRFIIPINFDLSAGTAIKELLWGSVSLSALLFTQVGVRKGCVCLFAEGDEATPSAGKMLTVLSSDHRWGNRCRLRHRAKNTSRRLRETVIFFAKRQRRF